MSRTYVTTSHGDRPSSMEQNQVSRFMCLVIMSLVLVAGLTTFILWLTFRPHHPKYTVHEFALQGLGHPNEPSFIVAARNPNWKIGIYYEHLNGSIYYKGQYIGTTPLILSPLYQEPKSTTQLPGHAISDGGISTNDPRWMGILDDRARGRIDFLVKLTGAMQYKLSMFDQRHHKLTAKCKVSVGPDGLMMPFSEGGKCDVSVD